MFDEHLTLSHRYPDSRGALVAELFINFSGCASFEFGCKGSATTGFYYESHNIDEAVPIIDKRVVMGKASYHPVVVF